MKSPHYDLKKKYFELLAADPDYPAWQDFEWQRQSGEWCRLENRFEFIDNVNFRYNPLPKTWNPIGGWDFAEINVSNTITEDDLKKLQAYATKLSWLREQGGYEFEIGKSNFFTFKFHENSCYQLLAANNLCQQTDGVIYMSEAQVEKWLEMVKNGEV